MRMVRTCLALTLVLLPQLARASGTAEGAVFAFLVLGVEGIAVALAMPALIAAFAPRERRRTHFWVATAIWLGVFATAVQWRTPTGPDYWPFKLRHIIVGALIVPGVAERFPRRW